MNEDFSNRLLERIEEEHIKPLPRWVVLGRRTLTWIILGLSVVCASLLGSLLVLAVLELDLSFLRRTSLGPMLRLVLEYVPMLWVLLFIALGVLEVVLLRHETRAYRYSSVALAGLVFLAASLIGLGLYATKLPERLEASLEERLPRPIHGWAIRRPPPRPEQGTLFGEVLRIEEEQFTLRGPRGEVWRVTLPGKSLKEIDLIRPGQLVLIEGRVVERGIFEGGEIRPFQGRLAPSGPRPRSRLQTF